MAEIRVNVSTVKRSQGRSSCASAAYLAGDKIKDERTGEIHDYSRKGGVEYSEIILPDGVSADWAKDRAALWNAVESTEKRKDARVARAIVFNIPHEIPDEAKERYSVEFCQAVADKYGTVVDLSIHAPPVGGDPRNWHGHGLMSTREIEADGFGAKTVILDSAKTSGAEIMAMRKINAEMTNRYLREAGFSDRDVSELSLIDQGITDRVAGEHMGPSATAIERRGEVSEKRTNHEAQLPEKLAAAAEAGELVREIEAADEQLQQAVNDAGGWADIEIEVLDEHLQSANDVGEIERELEKTEERIIVLDGNLQAAIKERDRQADEARKREKEKQDELKKADELKKVIVPAGLTTHEKALENKKKNQQKAAEREAALTPMAAGVDHWRKNIESMAIANRKEQKERNADLGITGEIRPESAAAAMMCEFEQERSKRLTLKMSEYKDADKAVRVDLKKAEGNLKADNAREPEAPRGVFAPFKQAGFEREYSAWQVKNQKLKKEVRELRGDDDRLEKAGRNYQAATTIEVMAEMKKENPTRWKEVKKAREIVAVEDRQAAKDRRDRIAERNKEQGRGRGQGHDQGIGD